MEQDNIELARKPLYKKWWFWVIIIIIVAFGAIATKGILHNKQLSKQNQEQEKEKKQGNSNELKDLVSSEDLPACPSDTSEIFTKAFMDGNKPDFITPLGNSSQSGHVIAVDHVYPSDFGLEKDMPVYAPGDITLVWVENKQMHNKNTDAITRADYQLNFAPCRGINLAFIHLKGLSPKLKEAIGDENSNCSEGQKMDYGTQEGVPTYYVTCHPQIKKIRLSAGELVGYFSGQTDRDFSGFDIGLYDFNKPAVGFITPERYYPETNHTACFADYYIPELKAKYYAKFGTFLGRPGEPGAKLSPITGEPKCGKVNYDIAGTASGDWFKNKLNTEYITDQDALVLITDNIDRNLRKFSMANFTSFTFTPAHTGTTNREYSEVKNDGKVYCYEDPNSFSRGGPSVDKNGNPVKQESYKYLIQMTDDTHMNVEQQSGTCLSTSSSGTGQNTFNNPFNYER